MSLLDAAEVSKILGVPTKSVYQIVSDGHLPSVRIGRRIRFRPTDVQAFIAKGGFTYAGGWRREPAEPQ